MKYPVIFKKTDKDRVVAVCPILNNMYAAGDTLDEALELLGRKFLLQVHDPEMQLDIMSLEQKGHNYGKQI